MDEQTPFGLQIDLETNEETFWVDGNHEAFEGTPFEGAPFRIKVRNLSRTDIAAIQRRHSKWVRGQQRTDDVAIGVDVFAASVLAWEGIGDREGRPLVCDETTKRRLADKYWTLAAAVSGAVMLENSNRAVRREAEQKN